MNEKRKSRFYNFSRKFTKKLGKKKDQTTQSEKVKKESDKKLASMRDRIKELEIENKILKEVKQQKVSYVQNVVNIHGLEPLDLSQERFDRIVENNYFVL